MYASVPAPDGYPRAAGEASRERIKQILRERKAAGLRAPTLDELAAATGLSKTTVNYHLRWMERHGIVRIEEARREIVLLEDEEDVINE